MIICVYNLINIFDISVSKILQISLGKREVTAVLYPSRRSAPSSRPEDDFQTLPVGDKSDLQQRPVTGDG